MISGISRRRQALAWGRLLSVLANARFAKVCRTLWGQKKCVLSEAVNVSVGKGYEIIERLPVQVSD